MAVTKIWAIHDSVSRVVDYCTNPSKTKLSDLEQVLLYAADKEKTLDEGEQQYAVTGIGCRAESAAREMAAVQRRFGKAGGNVAYHAYQSFKTGEVTAEECHRIGVETARRLRGNDRQVLVATHFNTGTYHNHFVVNPVNMWTGKKLEAKYEVYYKLRDMSDRVCKEHGLSVVKNPQRHKTARSVYFAEKDGEPTRVGNIHNLDIIFRVKRSTNNRLFFIRRVIMEHQSSSICLPLFKGTYCCIALVCFIVFIILPTKINCIFCACEDSTCKHVCAKSRH